MADIPTLTEYDGKRAKIRCSVHWLITHAYQDDEMKHIPRCDIEHVFECDGGVKKTVAFLLCSGEPYCRITEEIFDVKEQLRSHEDVIQILCSRGLYVLDDADSLIRADHLRKMPLALFSHIKIIDMLMMAYTSHKLTSVNLLVKTVRKFSEFSASKESPDNLEEAFILWINKISQIIKTTQRNAFESDKHTFGQQREENSHFPYVTNLTEDLYDGRALALILHYYCPTFVPFQEISMKDPISIADSWHNLQLGINFCNDVLLPHNKSNLNIISPSILHPVDFLYCSPHMNMDINVMAFLGSLYHYLETDALEDVVTPIGHSIICRRQRETSGNIISSSSESIQRPTAAFSTLGDRHQQTVQQASYLVPDVQPLISNATKRSFSKPSTPDTDSVSTITMNESDGHTTPLPFSSKPLLVRRNRDHIVTTGPSSTSKLYNRALTDHLQIIKSKEKYQNYTDYLSDDCSTVASSALHPLRKSKSHQGLTNGDINHHYPHPDTNVTKWQSPVQDLRNTNTSNNTYVTAYGGFDTPLNDSSKYSTTTTRSETTDYLSNVEMDGDDVAAFKPRERIHGQANNLSAKSRLPFSSITSPVFKSPHNMRHRNENDMVLETARTPESQSTRSTLRNNVSDSSSSSNSDFTSVSSRTTSNDASQECSSNSIYRNQNGMKEDYPVVIDASDSPELPRNVTHVKPYQNPHAGTSTNFAPSSQKSYTVQNGDFQSVDSARAAGYPVIDISPENYHQKRLNHNTKVSEYTDSIRSSQLRSSGSSRSHAINGSGDPGGTIHQAIPSDHVVISGSVVKLRNPQRRSNRSSRNNKAFSWVNNAKPLQVPNSENLRRHSNVPSAGKLSAFCKKIEERRRRIEERKKLIEDEKKIKQREWTRELSKLDSEIKKLDLHNEKNEQQRKHVQQHKPPTVPHHVTRTNKNEETSSDYSSKSPSPSSVNNNSNVVEHLECGNRILQQFVERNRPESPQSESYNNFFASPLSTTTVHANRLEQSNNNSMVDQAYQINASSHSSAHSRLSDQKQTFDVGPDKSRVLPPHSNRTYNVTQPDQHYPEQFDHRSVDRLVQKPLQPNFDSFERTMITPQSHSDPKIIPRRQMNVSPSLNQQNSMYNTYGDVNYHQQYNSHPTQHQHNFQMHNGAFPQRRDNSGFQPVQPNGSQNVGHTFAQSYDNRQMTYDVSETFGENSSLQQPVPQVSSHDFRQKTYEVHDAHFDNQQHIGISANPQQGKLYPNSQQDFRQTTYDVSNPNLQHNNIASPTLHSVQHQTSTQNQDQRQMTYNVSANQFNEHQPMNIGPSIPPQPVEVVHPNVLRTQAPDINIHHPSPEHTTRRSLFPGGEATDPDTSAEQENIDPNYLATGPADQTTYDTFSHKIAAGSNHSTPQKMSPLQGSPPSQDIADDETDMSSVLLKTADIDKKGGKGFELVDEATPNTAVAKKKEQFLLKQLKKEEELKRKKVDRENQAEKRKEEARQKQEELTAKKEEEKLKRQQRLEEYKKRKLQQEEAQLVQQSSAIIAGGSGKKHPPSSAKTESSSHTSRSHKVTKSGRSSPAHPESTVLTNNYDQPIHDAPDNHETYLINMETEDGSTCSNARSMLTQKTGSAGHKKEWDNQSASSSAVSSEYTGPKLYKQPSSKSNKHIVYNAICHCCLPGKVNETSRNNTIQVLEMSDARHYMILFRDAKCQFRALYSYDPDGEHLKKLAGNGPANIVPNMIERLFKYNSGRKAFVPLPSKTLSVSIDAITIKNSLWQTNRKVNSAKK